jgi:nucleotide-binding universal stress UspA family protein
VRRLPYQLKEILVPVDGSEASLDAVALACALAKRNRGKVYAVYVIEVARSLPLDAPMGAEADKGERILEEAERVAKENDYELEGELLQARDAGHAIVDEAIERGVEAIIMGVEPQVIEGGYEWPTEGKPRPVSAELPLGRVARYVVQHAPCEVWIIRRPLPVS